MSADKLVDSTQLDADLVSVANAIRAKGGTSASLAFPSGFVSAIADMPSGGTNELIDWLTGELNVVDLTGVTAVTRTLRNLEGRNFTVLAPDLLELPAFMFHQSTSLKSITCPKVTSFGMYALYKTGIAMLVAPNAIGLPVTFASSSSTLNTVDVGPNCSSIAGSCFSSTGINLLIMRRSSSIVSLGNTTAFRYTPFDTGGSGGTIYIPKSLYDALGTGTSSDYKAATNWSTIDGYGTITWAKIEGSYYESHYADGTPIE